MSYVNDMSCENNISNIRMWIMYSGYMSYVSYVSHMSVFMNCLKYLVFCF